MVHKITEQNLLRDRHVLGKGWNGTYGGYFSDLTIANRFVDAAVPHFFKKGNKNIDIVYACAGNGFLGEVFCQRLQELGANPSLTLIEASKEHLAQNANSKTHKINADLLEVKLARQFDVAIMRSSLDYFPTNQLQREALRCIARHLKPGGVLFNQCAALGTARERNLVDKCYGATISKIGKRHFQCDADISKIYYATGFGEVQKIGSAKNLVLTHEDYAKRYKIGAKDIATIRKIIRSAAFKHPNVRLTQKGYMITFHYPIYAARK